MTHPHETTRAFIASLPFKPDPFQGRAISTLESGRSVLVSAPTGSGKTVVADFAAFAARQNGHKLIYTTPIKALSNQKYRQLVAQYGEEHVGLVTGDTVLNRTAQILVMTTEILRNLLVVNRDPLEFIQFIVIDEIHFLSDRERGVVWEEVIIACPKHIQFVCLSATVRNADELVEWLTFAHGPTDLVEDDMRPVPLEDYVFTDSALHLLRDAKGHRPHKFPMLGVQPPRSKHNRFQPRQKARRQYVDPGAEVGILLARMRTQDLLPAIYFRFGRRSTEELAWKIVATEILPRPVGEAAALIRERIEAVLALLGEDAVSLHQVVDVTRLLPYGIAYHHGGLIYPLKSLVERLFADGLIQVVVATSTLSMGLHLPARSVIIGEMKKFNGDTFQPLTATEYRQMTGRAGRRGIDNKGAAVLVPDPNLPFEAAFKAMSGEPEPLRSAFQLRYNTLLNVYRPDDEERIAVFLEKNLAEFHRLNHGLQASLQRKQSRQQRSLLPAMLEVLASEGLLTEDHLLTQEGSVARHIFNSWEVAVTHVLFDDALSELEPFRVAELMSLFIPSKLVPPEADKDRAYFARRRYNGRADLLPEEHLEYVIESTTARLRGRERRVNLSLTPEWIRPNHAFIRQWCEKGSLKNIVDTYNLPVADALGLLGQTQDLLDQARSALIQVFGKADHRVAILESAQKQLSRSGLLEQLLGA